MRTRGLRASMIEDSGKSPAISSSAFRCNMRRWAVCQPFASDHPLLGFFKAWLASKGQAVGFEGMRSYWVARPLGGTWRQPAPDEKQGAARAGLVARSRRPRTSLRRFGAVIPGRLCPHRACFRFAALAYRAIAVCQMQFAEEFVWRSVGLPRATELWHDRAQFLSSASP